jgi:hypothetical protein
MHKNTSFIHSCWKTLPARRPRPSLEKITNHDELLTTDSISWTQRVSDLYVWVASRKKEMYICYIFIFVDQYLFVFGVGV